MHHFMRSSAYADIVTACGNAKLQMNDAGPNASGNTLCYVKNDTHRPFSGTVVVELVHFATAQTTVLRVDEKPRRECGNWNIPLLYILL